MEITKRLNKLLPYLGLTTLLGAVHVGCAPDASEIYDTSYANSQTLLADPLSWPSFVDEGSTQIRFISQWFSGAAIEVSPQTLNHRAQETDHQSKEILAQVYCYQGPHQLKLEDVFLATIGSLSDRFVQVGQALFGADFSNDAKVRFMPEDSLHIPQGLRSCSLSQPIEIPRAGSNLDTGSERYSTNCGPSSLMTSECAIKSFKEFELPQGLNQANKAYVDWLRGLPIVWPSKLMAKQISSTEKSLFKVTMLRRTLGALLDDVVRDSHRLNASMRVQALREIIQGLFSMPLKTKVSDVDDVTLEMSPSDGTILRIVVGQTDFDAITIGKLCLTKGAKENGFEALAEKLKKSSSLHEPMSISPGVCRILNPPSGSGPFNPVWGGFGIHSLTNIRNRESSPSEGQLGDYVPRPIIHTYFNLPPPPNSNGTATDCSKITPPSGSMATQCRFRSVPDLSIYYIGGSLTNFRIVADASFYLELKENSASEPIYDSHSLAAQAVAEHRLYFKAMDPSCPKKGTSFKLKEIPALLQEKDKNPVETSVLFVKDRAHEFFVQALKKDGELSEVIAPCIFVNLDGNNTGVVETTYR